MVSVNLFVVFPITILDPSHWSRHSMEISYFYSVNLILSKQSTYDQEFLGRTYITSIPFFQLFVLSGEGSKGKVKQSEGWVSGCGGTLWSE